MKSKAGLFIPIGLAMMAIAIIFLRKKDEHVDGGPCSYSITAYPAKVISIDTIGKAGFEITFEAQADGYADTLLYSSEFHHYASQETLDTSGIALGEIFRYEHHQITSGSCAPDIFMLRLKKFNK